MTDNEAVRTWTDDSVLRSGPESLRALRGMRANPPGAANKGERGEVFRAALEQAEQQWTAAGSVGYESRPLNLFYGLSQAGRAVAAAAKCLQRREWELKGHGITANPAINGVNTISDFPVMVLKRDDGKPGYESGSFIRLSSVLSEHCDLGAGAMMGQLWAGVLETARTKPLNPDAPGPLTFEVQSGVQEDGQHFRGSLFSGLVRIDAEQPLSDKELAHQLDPYPALRRRKLRTSHGKPPTWVPVC